MSASRIRLIAVLALSQIVGWGTTFDLPGVLGRPIAAELGMANELAFAGLSTMMLVAALLGPLTGRLLARFGAAQVLTLGSLIFAAGLGLLALAQEPVLYFLAWLVIGIGGAFGLSVPAYAAVVEREGSNAKQVIALLMIFTGLSAAVFWPIWSFLQSLVGWRGALALAAALHLLVMAPLHRFGLPPRVTETAKGRAAADVEPLALTSGQSRLALGVIALVTVLFNLVTVGIAPSLIELLRQSGASPALALQLGSLRSVLGISARAVDLVSGKRQSALTSGCIAASLILLAMPILALSGGSPLMLLLFVACYGFGSGISAVTRALLPLSFFSPSRYARISANLSLPANLAMAAAPVIATAVLDRGGTGALMVYSAVIAGATLCGLMVLTWLARRGRVSSPLAETA